MTTTALNLMQRHFSTLGFSDKEQMVFLAIAGAGKTTASVASKKTTLPRATVYLVLDSLLEKRVIVREQAHGTSLFQINELNCLQKLVEREREAVEQKDESAKELITLLTPHIKDTQYSVPKLQFFEGKKGVENMLYEYLPEWRKSMDRAEDHTLWGYQDPSIVDLFKKWHNHLWKTRGEKEVIHLLSNPSDVDKKIATKHPHREVRPLQKGFSFQAVFGYMGSTLLW